MEVGEQRIAADSDRLRPVLVAEGTVGADTQHLGIGRLEVAHAPIEGGHAGASARGPVERVEQQDHVLPAEGAQADLLEPDRLQGEVRRGIARTKRAALADGTHSTRPPLADVRGPRGIIACGIPARVAGFRSDAHRWCRRLSRGVSAAPTNPAAVTTRPVSHSRAKRSWKRRSRMAWWSMMTRQPVASRTRRRWSMARSMAAAPTSRSR